MVLYSGYGFGIDRNEKIEKSLDDEKKTAHKGDEKGKVWITTRDGKEDVEGFTSSHSPVLHSRFV